MAQLHPLPETSALKTDLGIAVAALKDNVTRYEKTTKYYSGDHDLAYATEKFVNAFGKMFREFSLNLCPAIVDAVRDKLVITSFGVEKATKEGIGDEAWNIWQANRMGKRSGEIHKEALRNGDAYAMVWVDAFKKVTIYPQRAASCTVFYDEETPGKVLWAAKFWKTADKKLRINLFFPDRIERYVTKKKSDTLPDETQWEKLEGDKAFAVANPYGIVPVFHFANNSDIGAFGVSELTEAIPIQNALNKSVLDMLIAMEFAAFRQRWITGIDVELDDQGNAKSPFVPGAERIWVTENENAKFGDFESADLKQFLEVKESFRVDMAAVTGTPLYYFMQTGGQFPSGEALQKAETRFVNKVRDRMQAFGQVWEDLMAFALTIENKGKDVRLFAEWAEPAPLSEKELLDNLITKQALGVDDEQLLMEAGYGAEDIAKMMERKAEKAQAEADRFNAGEVVDPLAEEQK